MGDPQPRHSTLLDDVKRTEGVASQVSSLSAEERAAMMASGIEFVRNRILPQYERDRDHAPRDAACAPPSAWFG